MMNGSVLRCFKSFEIIPLEIIPKNLHGWDLLDISKRSEIWIFRENDIREYSSIPSETIPSAPLHNTALGIRCTPLARGISTYLELRSRLASLHKYVEHELGL